MSSVIDFSEDDILRGKTVTPDWYRCRIGDFAEKSSKDGDSTNWTYENTRVMFNAENGSKEFEGVPITLRFNSKAKGFLIGFLNACGAEVKPGTRYNLAQASGKDIDVFVKNDVFENRLVNKGDSYRAPRAEAPAI